MSDDTIDPAAIARLERLGGAPFVRQMIELYLQHGPDRIRALNAGVANHDAREVERAAHALKSSAGNLGATRLQAAALALELLALAQKVDQPAAELVLQEYEASEAALRARLQELTA
jgi:HPt (histidine-containing phosphotransfer) domain-containing protein